MGTADTKSLNDYNSENLPLSMVPKVGESSEIVVDESSSSEQHWRQDLIVKILPKETNEGSTEDAVIINMPPSPLPTPKRVNFSPLPSPNHMRVNESPGPSFFKGKSTMKALLPKLSFKFRNTNSEEIQKAAMLALGASPEIQGKTSIVRNFSLSKIFTPRMKRTSSLPATPILHSNPESTHGGIMATAGSDVVKGGPKMSIHRSRSVPVLSEDGSGKQIDYLRSVFRVISTTPQVNEQTGATSTASETIDAGENSNHGEDIPEEEAVCRICFIELGEGSSLKMECSCKGELALAHQECVIKWFSIKGNKTCDVCQQEVKNLPVTLLRIQNTQPRHGTRPSEIVRYRVWQDVPVLVIVSMLAYFCFLEQLLVNKMGSSAIAISLPFACILGLLASMASTTMVRRRFTWLYAAAQFALVVLFAHIFYSLLHLQPVLSVLLATFAGFGGAMCGTSILFEFFKWRRSWRTSFSNSQQQQDSVQPNRGSETVNVNQSEAENQGTGLGS